MQRLRRNLTSNESKVLAAALRLRRESVDHLYGYGLFLALWKWESGKPMNHGSVFRCLRSLERRRAFCATVVEGDGGSRVFYELTGEGQIAALGPIRRRGFLGGLKPVWLGTPASMLSSISAESTREDR
jgi:Transcriptional regulator PadR-like family